MAYVVENYLHTLTPPERDKVLARVEERAVEKARTSFKEFVQLYGKQVDPDFKFGRHIEVICDRLERAFYRAWRKSSDAQTDRLQVSLPPGGSKSQTCTRLFPAWCLGVNPRTRFIIVGHGIDFARDEFGMKILDIIRSPEYQKIFPNVTLRADKQASNRFLTTEGGEVICTGVEAAVAGRRCGKNDQYVHDVKLGPTLLSDLLPGAEILGPNGVELVTAVLVTRDEVMYNINFLVEVNSEHPFQKTDGTWAPAEQLRCGDRIRTESLWTKIKNYLDHKLLPSSLGRV